MEEETPTKSKETKIEVIDVLIDRHSRIPKNVKTIQRQQTPDLIKGEFELPFLKTQPDRSGRGDDSYAERP
jgi:hypothetical protein